MAVRLTALVALLSVVGCTGGQGSPSPTASATGPTPSATFSSAVPTISTAPDQSVEPPTSLGFETFVEGLAALTFAGHAGDGTGRLYAVEQRGVIWLIEADGTRHEQPFLDIGDRVRAGGERGLLGLAFALDYPSSGRLFVDYTDGRGDTVVAEYRRATDTTADPASERVLLQIAQPAANHNGGMLAFGPDGALYVATGDGGAEAGTAQDLNSLLGKILRLDVDAESPTPEVFALGLRNPWRFSFDRDSGDMWIGDVGGQRWEEVDVAPSGTTALNFGWNVMEGPDCYRGTDCARDGLTLPVAWHGTHEDGGCALTGGYVYRGAAVGGLAGTYLFSDYCAGLVWGLDAGAALRDGSADYRLLGSTGQRISSFGEDESGELYLVTDGGAILRIVASD